MQQLILTGPDKKIELLFKELNLKLRRWGIEVEWKSLAPPEQAIEGDESAAELDKGEAPGNTKDNDSGGQTNDDVVKDNKEDTGKYELTVKADATEKTDAASEAGTADTIAKKHDEEPAKKEAEKASVNVTGKPDRVTKQDKKADNLKNK